MNEDPYGDGWRELTRREWYALAGLAAFPVGGFICLAPFGESVVARFGPAADALLVAPWVLVAGLAIAWRAMCPCPRCGKALFVRGLYGNAFARKCLNCGIPLWSPGERDHDETHT